MRAAATPAATPAAHSNTPAAHSNTPAATPAATAQSERLQQGVLDTRFALRALTRQQQDAAINSVSSSRHTKLTIMPNHSINLEGELEGFVFECAADDMASVLPITKCSFFTTAIYECIQDNGSAFLQLTTDMHATTDKLRRIVRTIEASDDETELLKFDCMPDWDAATESQYTFKDQRAWRENAPAKIGVYHCFMRTTAQNRREHKLFIVVSGHCRHASEELHNMWLDARHDITAGQFMKCAELDWLRKATLRHHSRLAARVAQGLNLNVRFIEDVNAVDSASMLLPSTSVVCRDLALVGGRVLVTSDAALLDTCKSGLVFDCFASEGFWVFMGPRDTGSYRMFGNEFQVTGKYQGFPTKTVRYNRLFPAREKTNVVTPYGRRTAACGIVEPSSVLQDVAKALHMEGREEYKALAELGFGKRTDQEQTVEHIIYAQPYSNITCFMFPHVGFLHVLSQLGFQQNDGIINLMPIAIFCDDE